MCFAYEIFAVSYVSILLNPNAKQADITNGIIAHEALHIVNMLFQERGV
jgi:predicted metal-dependent peptidase